MTLKLMIRKPLCWLGMCPCTLKDEVFGCWGECIHCGKVCGFVNRTDLRRYADTEYEARRRSDQTEAGG